MSAKRAAMFREREKSPPGKDHERNALNLNVPIIWIESLRNLFKHDHDQNEGKQ